MRPKVLYRTIKTKRFICEFCPRKLLVAQRVCGVYPDPNQPTLHCSHSHDCIAAFQKAITNFKLEYPVAPDMHIVVNNDGSVNLLKIK